VQLCGACPFAFTLLYREIPFGYAIAWSWFQFDMTGAELPYNRGAQFVAMPGQTGAQDTAIVYFQMRSPFEAGFEKSNLRGKEAGSIPSPRNDSTTHAYESSVSFSICIMDRM
jgi:hypothetical protein